METIRGAQTKVQAYARAGGSPICASQVHFHEVCLVAGWYREAVEQRHTMAPPEHYLQQLRALLRRVAEGG